MKIISDAGKLEKFLNIFFFLYVLSYALLIIHKANWGVIDDHTLISTIFIGKNIPFFINPEIGRFYPLDGFEYNLISKISVSPEIFYAYNAIQFVLLIVIFYKIIHNSLGMSKKSIFIYLILISLLPGFVTAWFRLFVPERNVLFFVTIFLYFFLKFQNSQRWIYFIIALISGNLALYYKEPVFIMLGSFALFNLIFTWKQLNFKTKLFNFMIIASCSVFIIIYYLLVFSKRGETLYGTVNYNPYIHFLKNFFNYILSDPILIFILIPMVGWRLFSIIIIKAKYNPIFDSLLIASFFYLSVFLKLNMFSYYYLLPIYGFALPAILYFMLEYKLFKVLFWKILIFLTVICLTFSSLPLAFHLISHYKNVPNNFQATLSFLHKYIKEKATSGDRVTIFLDGVNRNTGVEVYHSFITYLESKGLNHEFFDIKSSEDDNKILPLKINDEKSPYSIWKSDKGSKIESGDLLIITPYTTKFISLEKNEIKEMEKEYEILYKTDSYIEIPNIGIKSLSKIIYKKLVNKDKVILSENIYQLPLDFYVLRKK